MVLFCSGRVTATSQAWVETDSLVIVLFCSFRLAKVHVEDPPVDVGLDVRRIETDGLVIGLDHSLFRRAAWSALRLAKLGAAALAELGCGSDCRPAFVTESVCSLRTHVAAHQSFRSK